MTLQPTACIKKMKLLTHHWIAGLCFLRSFRQIVHGNTTETVRLYYIPYSAESLGVFGNNQPAQIRS